MRVCANAAEAASCAETRAQLAAVFHSTTRRDQAMARQYNKLTKNYGGWHMG